MHDAEAGHGEDDDSQLINEHVSGGHNIIHTCIESIRKANISQSDSKHIVCIVLYCIVYLSVQMV